MEARRGSDGGRVLVVDHHRLFAEAVRSLLEREGFEQVAVAPSLEEALLAAESLDPDLVLVDVGALGKDRIGSLRRILAACPRARVVSMGASTERPGRPRNGRGGFAAHLVKDVPARRFVGAIREIITRGRLPAVSEAAHPERSSAIRPDDPAFLLRQLTAREREVLGLLAEGENSRGIAERLSISRLTARGHVQNVLTRLQVHSRLEAATFAARHRIVAAEPAPGSDPASVHTGPSYWRLRLVADPHPSR